MLVRVMSVCGYRWYPEYTVEEQYRDFNQSQYICTVRVFPDYPGAEKPIHWSYGLGVTVDMAVQDAAYYESETCTAAEFRVLLCSGLSAW